MFTLEQVCFNLTAAAEVGEQGFRTQLTNAGVTMPNANALIAYLENVGIVFT